MTRKAAAVILSLTRTLRCREEMTLKKQETVSRIGAKSHATRVFDVVVVEFPSGLWNETGPDGAKHIDQCCADPLKSVNPRT